MRLKLLLMDLTFERLFLDFAKFCFGILKSSCTVNSASKTSFGFPFGYKCEILFHKSVDFYIF